MKFKNIKKKTNEKTKSPSNSQNISEPFFFSLPKFKSADLIRIYKVTLDIFVALIFIFALVIVGLDLKENLQSKYSLDSQREAVINNLSFWEKFISGHQNYADAYFQASIIEYKLGDMADAKMYVGKGLTLDPLSVNGKKIEQLLLKK
jgi:hypothetical protein